MGVICNPSDVMEIPVVKQYKDQEEMERKERKEQLVTQLKGLTRKLGELTDE